MMYFFAFLISVLIAYGATFFVKKLALRFDIVDHPHDIRKHHSVSTPLLGGIGVFVAIAVSLFVVDAFFFDLFSGYLQLKHVIGLLTAAGLLVFGGYLDDRYDLKPWQQILFPLIASIVVIISGIGIEYISNPFGTEIDLTQYSFQLFVIGEIPYHFVLFADIFTVIWLMGMTYATKTFDGVDGLVSGVVVISSMVLLGLSLSEVVMQPETALLAAILGGAFFGFLIWNFPQAKIFLGEGGSTLAGFMIGLLAIISGGKLATALLIMSIPIIDLAFVIFERMLKKQSPFKHADRKHIHMRLIDRGWSVRSVLLFMYVLVVFLGIISIQFEGRLKIILLGVFVLLFICFLMWISGKFKSERLD